MAYSTLYKLSQLRQNCLIKHLLILQPYRYFHLKTGLIYNLLRGGDPPYKLSILKTVPMAINVMFIHPSTCIYIYKHFQELLMAGIIKVTIITIHLESHGQINSYYHDNCHNPHLEINAITRFFSHECFLYKTGHMSVMSLSKLTIHIAIIACISRN